MDEYIGIFQPISNFHEMQHIEEIILPLMELMRKKEYNI